MVKTLTRGGTGRASTRPKTRPPKAAPPKAQGPMLSDESRRLQFRGRSGALVCVDVECRVDGPGHTAGLVRFAVTVRPTWHDISRVCWMTCAPAQLRQTVREYVLSRYYDDVGDDDDAGRESFRGVRLRQVAA